MIENKPVCLITGGTSGIGTATVKQFAEQGFSVCTCGRDSQKIAKLKSADWIGEDDLVVQVDLAKTDQTTEFANQAIQTFGQVDVLVNNAAVAPLEKFEGLSEQQFEQLVDLNIRSAFYLTQIIWKVMIKRGRGVVVNVSSMAAVDPFPGFSIYGASKAWAELMTTALADEGKEHGIRVYSVRPGAVETPLLRGLFPDFPAEQCVQPEDIAQQIWNCVSQPDSIPSGSHIPVVQTV